MSDTKYVGSSYECLMRPSKKTQEQKKGITRFFSFLFLELPYQDSHSTRYTITEKCLIHQIGLYISILVHTSKINDLCSSLKSEEMLQNFLCLYKKKTQVVFLLFISSNFHFYLYKFPWSKGKNESCSKLKMKTTTYLGFLFISI